MISTPERRTWTYEVRGLRLAAHEWGPSDAPIAVCIHGFMDHGRSFEQVAAHVGDELRLIAPDVRGHGESDWVGAGGYYHFYDYFQDLRRLVAILGNPPILILGHSMGGSIATGLAALLGETVRGVILLEGMGPSFSSLEQSRSRLERWVSSLDKPNVDGDVAKRRAVRTPMPNLADAAGRLQRVNPRLSPERALDLARSFSEVSGGGLVWRFDPLHRTIAAKPFLEAEATALWRSLSAPVLSLFGEHGMIPENLEARHAQLARVLVGWVRGAGHNLHHERPELVAEALLSLHRSGRPALPSGVSDVRPG